MNETLVPVVVDLMNKIIETCTQILSIANEELLSAREKKDKVKFVEYINEVTTLEQLIEIAKAIAYDVQKRKSCRSTRLLLKTTADSVARTLYSVATKRSLHDIIITGFKEADALINTKF